MGSFDFQQKNRKALVVVGGLMLVCISIALLTWTAGRDGWNSRQNNQWNWEQNRQRCL